MHSCQRRSAVALSLRVVSFRAANGLRELHGGSSTRSRASGSGSNRQLRSESWFLVYSRTPEFSPIFIERRASQALWQRALLLGASTPGSAAAIPALPRLRTTEGQTQFPGVASMAIVRPDFEGATTSGIIEASQNLPENTPAMCEQTGQSF